MTIPKIPGAVAWRNGMVLEPSHFQTTDDRTVSLMYLASLVADPWPWGFTSLKVDETALAAGQLRIECEGIFPGGYPCRQTAVSCKLDKSGDAKQADFHVVRDAESGSFVLKPEDQAPSEAALPAAKLVFHGGVWSNQPDWSAPALLIDEEHPIRDEMNRQLGSLSALAVGFATTLRLPGAEERPAARTLSLVATALAQGVGILQTLLAAPAVSPGRLGIEAMRMALSVRAAVRIFDLLDNSWDAADQRGSIRRLLYEAESAASGIGLPFRASLFQPTGEEGILAVEDAPVGAILIAIEATRPSDLIAGRSWFDGAAVAAPDRIQDALNRRVAGCSRRPIDRDARIGVSSGPLLALYHVDNDTIWRSGHTQVALAAKTPQPKHTSFSVLIAEEDGTAPGASSMNIGAAQRGPGFGGAPPGSGMATPNWGGGGVPPGGTRGAT